MRFSHVMRSSFSAWPFSDAHNFEPRIPLTSPITTRFIDNYTTRKSNSCHSALQLVKPPSLNLFLFGLLQITGVILRGHLALRPRSPWDCLPCLFAARLRLTTMLKCKYLMKVKYANHLPATQFPRPAPTSRCTVILVGRPGYTIMLRLCRQLQRGLQLCHSFCTVKVRVDRPLYSRLFLVLRQRNRVWGGRRVTGSGCGGLLLAVIINNDRPLSRT
jgi:hypothetical protein